MLKRKISIVLIIALLIALIIMSFKYKNLLEKYNFQQTNVNLDFKGELRAAGNDFGSDSLTVGNNKNDWYYQAISRVASSSHLCQHTTYNKKGLCVTLDDLCLYMKQEEYKESVIKKSKSISEYLLQLSSNPENKQVADNLDKLIKEISEKR